MDVQHLQDAGLYENQQEAVGREEVLGRLDQVEFIFELNSSICAV